MATAPRTDPRGTAISHAPAMAALGKRRAMPPTAAALRKASAIPIVRRMRLRGIPRPAGVPPRLRARTLLGQAAAMVAAATAPHAVTGAVAVPRVVMAVEALLEATAAVVAAT